MDVSCEASLEILRALAKCVKDACSRPGGLSKVSPAAIACLGRLRLGQHLERSDRENALREATQTHGKGGKAKRIKKGESENPWDEVSGGHHAS